MLIITLGVFTGCEVDTGKGQIVTPAAKQAWDPGIIGVVDAGEMDIIEQTVASRQAYRKGLENLISYYEKMGNNLKVSWAKTELQKLDAIPQYNYIIEAAVAGPELKATDSITAADELYRQASALESRAGMFLVVKDATLLRQALEKYNELIRKYPSSDKIDDAAYKAAEIYKHFNDETIALLYYQRTYQWNAETTYPARFKAAYILDTAMARRDQALELYRQSLEKESLSQNYRDYIQMRIADITRSEKEAE